MSETVTPTVETVSKVSVLKKFAKRTAIASAVVVVVAAIYVKTQSKDESDTTETPAA